MTTDTVVKAKALRQFKVTIHSEENGDKGDVIIAHNFKQIQIQRDKEVVINEYFLDTLKASVIDTYVKDENDKMRPVKIPRYSYSVEPV